MTAPVDVERLIARVEWAQVGAPSEEEAARNVADIRALAAENAALKERVDEVGAIIDSGISWVVWARENAGMNNGIMIQSTNWLDRARVWREGK